MDASDRDRLEKDTETAKHLGTIKVTVCRCVVKRQKKSYSGSAQAVPQEITLAEKAFKGESVSHSTT